MPKIRVQEGFGGVSFKHLGCALHQTGGVIGASLLARKLEREIHQLERGRGDIVKAEKLYEKALAMDPYADGPSRSDGSCWQRFMPGPGNHLENLSRTLSLFSAVLRIRE